MSAKTHDDVMIRLSEFRGAPRYDAGLSTDEIAARAKLEPDVVVVKTHALPFDDTPAIVVVRDGRPVMRSFARFRTEVAKRPTTIGELIADDKQNWSKHVTAWLDHDAPKIVLRYEKLRGGDQASLDAISRFIGMPQTGAFTASVDEIRAVRPTHIRDAANEPGIDEIETHHGEEFWSRHGDVMRRLNYTR